MRRRVLIGFTGLMLWFPLVWFLTRGDAGDNGQPRGATSQPARGDDDGARERLKSLGYLR